MNFIIKHNILGDTSVIAINDHDIVIYISIFNYVNMCVYMCDLINGLHSYLHYFQDSK